MDREILRLNEMAMYDGKKYEKRRYLFDEIIKMIDKNALLGIIGPRGIGKTIMLRQILSSVENSFYISLDSITLTNSLFDIANELGNKGIKYLLLDEIHFLPNFERELKKIYDFLDINIIFTGSVSIPLYRSAYDLSRRVKIYYLYPFSFDEFIFFNRDERIGKIHFSDFLNLEKAKHYYGKIIRFEHLFEDYIRGLLFPFTLETGNDITFFSNILNTIIRKDLLSTGQINIDEVEKLKEMLKFIGLSSVENISYSSISKNTGLTKYMVQKYSALLERTFILNIVMPKGTNVMKEPKILMNLPYRLLYSPYNLSIGAIREDFFVEMCRLNSIDINYLKSKRGEKIPDYFLPQWDIVIEIGGKNKSVNQFKGFPAKYKVILAHPGKLDELTRPLFVFGMVQK